MQQRRCATRRVALPLAILLVLTVFLIWLEFAEGGRKQQAISRRRTKKSRVGVGKDFSEFLLVIGAIMTCVIAPVFFFFLHSIYKDPATPELARACWNAVKSKLLSYLGQPPVVPGSVVDTNNTLTSLSTPTAARRRTLYSNDSTNYVDMRRDENGNKTPGASWASRQATTANTQLYSAGDAITERSYLAVPKPSTRDQSRPRRYLDDDQKEESPYYGYAAADRRYRRKGEDLQWHPAPGYMAPYSSGAILPEHSGGDPNLEEDAFPSARGAQPTRWREYVGNGRDRTLPAKDARFLGEKEARSSEPRRRVEWNPYPDDDDDDVGKELQGKPTVDDHMGRGVYKSTQSKRTVVRSKRARAIRSSLAGKTNGGRQSL
ncbi:unnamed protein product [Ectocarpus sp. 12 AP-2014]